MAGPKSMAGIAGILTLVFALAGCAGPSFVLGAQPAVDRLAELNVGTDGEADVRRVIGAPTGQGAARSPDFPGYRDIWSYQVLATNGVIAEYTILLIFFADGVYDGYLWFDNAHDFDVRS